MSNAHPVVATAQGTRRTRRVERLPAAYFYRFPVISRSPDQLLLGFCPWCPEEKARADAMEGTRYHGAIVRFTSRACPSCIETVKAEALTQRLHFTEKVAA